MLPLSFSAHLHMESTGYAFRLRMPPFDETEIDIEEGMVRRTKRGGLKKAAEESSATTLGYPARWG